jgi:uncharacterized protein (UPF0335 family)
MDQENKLIDISHQLETAKKENKNYLLLKKDMENAKIELTLTELKLNNSNSKCQNLSSKISAFTDYINQLESDKAVIQAELKNTKNEFEKISFDYSELQKEFSVHMEAKVKLEEENNALLGHKNSNQKVKYIAQMREDYNNLLNTKIQFEKLAHKLQRKEEVNCSKLQKAAELISLESQKPGEVVEELKLLLEEEIRAMNPLKELSGVNDHLSEVSRKTSPKKFSRQDSKKSLEDIVPRFKNSKSSENYNPFKN